MNYMIKVKVGKESIKQIFLLNIKGRFIILPKLLVQKERTQLKLHCTSHAILYIFIRYGIQLSVQLSLDHL